MVRWTAIVLTCQNKDSAHVYKKELLMRQQKGILDEDALILAVEDPKAQVGSGGATLNALLVVTEHLSAKRGFTVVNSEVLEDVYILILHMGRNFPFDACGRAFTTFPAQFQSPTPDGIVCNFDALYESITNKVAHDSPPGLWVSGTDAILTIPDVANIPWSETLDVVAIAIPTSPQYAKSHGVYKIDGSGNLTDIVYRGEEDAIKQCALESGSVPIIASLVYFNTRVIEKFIGFHVMPPLDACTYMGLDSGAQPIQLSLFFDFLLCMASNVKEEDFTSGSRSVAYASKSSQAESKGMKNARSILWKHLHGTAVKTVVLETASYDYLTSQFDVTAQDHHKQLLHCPLQYEGSNYLWSTVVHSNIQDKSSIPENSTILNSVLGQNISIEGRSVMSHCNLVGQTNLHIGSQSIVSGLISEDLEPQQPPCAITLPNDIVLQGFHIKIPTLQGESKHQRIMTVFGKYDHLLGPTYKGSSSYCNTPWVVFMNRTGISQEDLWDSTVPDNKKCSMNAKLFPLFHVSECVGIREILWLAGGENIHIDSNVLDRWRSSWRLSFEEILNFIDLQAEFQHRRKLFFEIAKIDIVNTLEGKNGADINKGLCNVYASAVAEGLHFEVLETLDQVAMETSSAGVAARTLANIADVLGCMARNNGGLRSGPAANKSWGRAFHLLENGSIREGVSAMSEERAKWLERPDLLVRAARHYEGAAQILIRHAVMSARQFISTTKSELPPIGRWVMAECPARIDLSGGWSDTPPITYEHGGAVTNVSVLYDGKKPIGAKARRIERPEIVLHLEGRELVLTELSHLEDYCQPYAPGALLKACILCAELVDFPSDVSLREQLLQRYNGGIELHSWSQLPHGSGLGGSSILAGAVMGVLWNISGQAYDNKSLIHAVLHLEQMLTTGGGWQDQVGALVGGVKIGVSKGELPLYVDIIPLDVAVETVQAFSDRLILVYTGKTRLARNLLQNVIRNWYGRNPDILATQDALVENAHDCAKAFEQGDLEKVGECMNKYWEQKKKMAPGCEPSVVARMMASLREHTYGMTLAGAGGGGFMYVLMKNPGGIALVKEILSQIEGTENATVHKGCVDTEGMTLTTQPDDIIA